MSLRILYLQFRTDATITMEHAAVMDKVGRYRDDVLVEFRDAFDPEVRTAMTDPATFVAGYDAVMLGGSGEFYFGGNIGPVQHALYDRLIDGIAPLLRHLLRPGSVLPVLGICFGHQMLAHFLGTAVVNDPAQAETGTFPLTMTDDGVVDPLLAGVAQGTAAYFVHRDSVVAVPDGAVLLAATDRCGVAAFRYGRAVYGVQFHPEIGNDDILPRIMLHPEYLPMPLEDFEVTLTDVSASVRVLHNFLDILVVRRA